MADKSGNGGVPDLKLINALQSKFESASIHSHTTATLCIWPQARELQALAKLKGCSLWNAV
jgi:hypothetical protein